MNPFIWKMSIPVSLAAVIVACGGGSGGLAGIGGSGYISSGSVTGFGSVYVNGIKFDTDSARYDIEDNSGSQQDLRIGMVVQVEGSVNADGVSGTATGIRYGDQLQGPVSGTLSSGAIDVNADVTTKSFRVMGSNVIVDAVDTVYEGTSFELLDLNNVLEISGYYDQNEVLHATYIELKASVFNAAQIVEVEGYISDLNGSAFMLRNVNVNAASANLSGFSNGLENAVYAEVKGTYNISTNTITASEVEAETIEFKDDGSEISIEGYITRYVSNSDFDIDGHKINAANAQFAPASLQLSTGLKVEAEGTISNGVLNADEIESSSGDAKISAQVETVNVSAGTFTVRVVTGEPLISVSVDNSTTLEDDLLEIEPFKLLNLNPNDFVEIVGYETATSAVTATKVKRREAGDRLLQGLASAVNGIPASGDVTVLGVIFNFNSTDTTFENAQDQTMDTAEIEALITSISASPTLIKIVDKVSVDGIADEIDLEN